MKIFHCSSLNSTNEYLKQNYKTLNDFTVIYVDKQTNGHGRYNRTWESAEKENLLCSILLKDLTKINNINSLSLLVGAVIYKVLTKHKLNNVFIKWPNDIYANDKKICGILLESVSTGENINAVIIGIGLNLNQKKFQNKNATSYILETKQNIKITTILKQILKIFFKELTLYKKNKSNYIYVVNNNNYLFHKKAIVFIVGNKKEAVIQDINLDNSLNAIIDSKRVKINTGEIILLNQ